MYAPAYEFFLEFGAHCLENYPAELSVNASTLVRTGVIGPVRRTESRSLRSRLRRFGGVDWWVARVLTQRALHQHRVAHGGAEVLAVLPFNRRDYEALVLPYLHGVADHGTRSGVVVSEASTGRWARLAERTGWVMNTFESEATMAAYRDSRRALTELRPALLDAATRFGKGNRVQRDLFDYFAQFTFQRAVASRLIERLAPRVVLGLHFVYARGWQAAIEGAKCSGRKPTVVLAQHGAFEASDGFHDFEGADLVLLWGERWQRELQRFSSLPFRPVPAAVVTGSPKFDGPSGPVHHDADVPISENRQHGRARVLYVSSHEDGTTLPLPLATTVRASKREPGFEVVVKPHPAERVGTFQALVDNGELRAESILSPRRALQDCILEADVVVGPRSTALYEAARLGKPVILVAESPGTAFEGLITVPDDVGLHATIERLVSDVDWRRAVLARQVLTLQDALGVMEGAVGNGVEQIEKFL